MSAQAAVVFLQSISEFTVNSISARYLINDATESNVAHQGIVGIFRLSPSAHPDCFCRPLRTASSAHSTL